MWTPTSAAHRRKEAQNVLARYDSSSSRFSASLRKGTTDCRICDQGKTTATSGLNKVLTVVRSHPLQSAQEEEKGGRE
jgi:hypothetical protein